MLIFALIGLVVAVIAYFKLWPFFAEFTMDDPIMNRDAHDRKVSFMFAVMLTFIASFLAGWAWPLVVPVSIIANFVYKKRSS